MADVQDRNFWTNSYGPGVPKTLDLGERTFSGLIDASFEKYANRPAAKCLGATWTYGRLDADADAMAASLQGLNLAPGSRVAIMMPSIPQYLVAMIGVMRAGFIVVNVNPLYTARELRHQLQDSGAEAIILLEQFAATFEEVKNDVPVNHVVVTNIGTVFGGIKGLITNFVLRTIKKAVPKWSIPGALDYASLVSAGKGKAFKRAEPKPDDTAVLQYTGGTTGIAKGAVLTQLNLLAASETAGAWLQPALDQEPKITEPVFMIPLPLYHVFTLYVTSMGLSRGACCVLVPNPRDLDSLMQAMVKNPANLMIGLNTLYAALIKHQDIGQVDFSGMRGAVAGGTATHMQTAIDWEKMTGGPILEGWGMTETTGAGTCNPFPSDGFTGSIGLPMPSIEISIRNDDREEMPIGEAGEIWIKGPNVMAGYWNRPEATEAAFDGNGFLATGDIGTMDDKGFVRIVDRKKDMVLVSGFNVYPNEIEDVLASMVGVAEAAAIGVPDDKTGEAVKVFVVRTDPSVDEAAVKAHCAKNLTNYKRPRHVEFIDELPKSPVGKILRKDLRKT